MFKRIDTVFLPARNLNEAIKWYTDICNFSLRWHDEKNGNAAMDIGNGETAFTLVQKVHMKMQMPREHEWFTLYTDDIYETYQAFKSAGVVTTSITDDGNMLFFHFEDLDGNVIGVCTFEEFVA